MQNSSSTWNSTSPALTPCFTQTVLSWIPFAFLLVCFPFTLYDYLFEASKRQSIAWNRFNILKLVLSLGLTVIGLVHVVDVSIVWFKQDSHISSAEFVDVIVRFFTFILLTILVHLQRVYGYINSAAIWFGLFVQIMCNLASIPTLFKHSESKHSIFVYCELAIEIVLLIVSSVCVDKVYYYENVDQNTQNTKKQKICPRESASIPSKLTFWWFHSFAWLGFRRTLTQDDVWATRRADRATGLFERFNHFWKHKSFTQQQQQTSSTESEKVPKTNFMFNIMKQFWRYFLVPSVALFITDNLQLLNPIMLKQLIGFISDENVPFWHGYFYTAVLVLINIVCSISVANHQHRMTVLGMRIRACLTGALYRKSLVLATHSKKDYTTGELVNLMAVDTQRVIDLLPTLYNLYTAPVLIVIALWLLYQELGVSVFGGLLLIILFIPAQAYSANFMKRYRVKEMALKDRRLKAINELLNGIKVLKLYAWEKASVENIEAIRKQELGYILWSGYVATIFNVLFYCSPFIVTCFSFALYILIDPEHHRFTAQKAFVSVALFNMLRLPLGQIPNMTINLISALVSVKRLNKFLNCDETSSYVSRTIHPSKAITLHDASFSWDQIEPQTNDDNSFMLTNLNLEITKGSLVAIVGSVGAGKSSLLSALLGEMEKQAGQVNISGDQRVAYVAQQAWIQNTSLRDNILFGSELEMVKYRAIIDACALQADLNVLPAGDETEIGEKGINLSGGQKQRVSIARACYAEADLYLLDDPLSAVDSHVGKHIFNEVFHSKSGLLRGKTRILVTNALYMLPNVDQIVLLKSGTIEASGTYDHLMEQNSVFRELITNYTSGLKGDDEEDDDDKSSEIEESFENAQNIVKQRSTSKLESNEPKNSKSKLVESEHMEIGQITLSVYIKYMKSLTIFGSAIVFVIYALSIGSNTGANMWLSVWTSHADDADGDDMKHYLLIYVLIGCLQLVFVSCGWMALVTASYHASRTLHTRFIEAIAHAPMHFFDTTPLGRIVNRFSKDIDILDIQIILFIRVLLDTTFTIFAAVIIVSYQTTWFIAVVVPFVVVYFFIQRFYVSTTRQLKRLEAVTRSPIYNHFSETLNGVCTIKAYNAAERFIRESDYRVDENQRFSYPGFVSTCWLQVWLEFFANFLVFFASLFAISSKGSVGGLSSSQIGLSLSYALSLTDYLNTCVRMFSFLENSIVSVERICEYTEIQSEAAWHNQVADEKISPNWPEDGQISFVEYSTRYRPDLDLVLKQIDFSIRKGEKVGIVGRTGAGKSSITLALYRIIEAAHGKILIDGVDIATLGLHTLRSRITIIPQDPVLFCGTIRDNLDPFTQYTDQQLYTVLELAHLKTFVSGLTLGLQHSIVEGGDNLSVGQRQLICLARALLRRTKVLVLDEATAAVDAETDSLIQSTIRAQFGHCTVLTIAHRLNTILDSDRVMVLEAGNVAEFDAPTNLLSNQNSIFYSLAKDAGIV